MCVYTWKCKYMTYIYISFTFYSIKNIKERYWEILEGSAICHAYYGVYFY